MALKKVSESGIYLAEVTDEMMALKMVPESARRWAVVSDKI